MKEVLNNSRSKALRPKRGSRLAPSASRCGRQFAAVAWRVASRIFRTFCSSQVVRHWVARGAGTALQPRYLYGVSLAKPMTAPVLCRYLLVHIHVPLHSPFLSDHVARTGGRQHQIVMSGPGAGALRAMFAGPGTGRLPLAKGR